MSRARTELVLFACAVALAPVLKAAPAAPQNVVATAVSSSQINLTWTALPDAVSYDVYHRKAGTDFTKAGSTMTNSFSDIALSSDTTYIYEVQAIDATSTAGPLSNPALGTTTIFNDDPLVSEMTLIQAVHFTQLRTAVNAVRAAAALGAYSFTDPTLDSTIGLKSTHVVELRTALNAALNPLTMPLLGPTNSADPGTEIHTIDVGEIRGHVSGITSSQPAPISFCARGPASQTFSAVMQGCAGTVLFSSSATLCGAGYHVCSANEYVANRNGVVPIHHYWTANALQYAGSAVSCYVVLSGGGVCLSPANMLVCSPLGDAPNTCTWINCGFNSTTPNQYFGGCSGNTAGTICCANAVAYVNVATGSDANPGTAAAPFKTITHALSVATPNEQIVVATGTYSAASGETFPLTLPAGVALIGDEVNSGNGAAPTVLSGGATAMSVIIAGAGSTIAGFKITGATTYGVQATASGAVIRNNTITANGGYGLVVNAPGCVFTGNTITSNATAGIYAYGSAAGAKFERNVATNNGTGIYAAVAIDLGGGSSGSGGGNTISCNTNADLWVATTGLSANNNQWDHSPPTTSTLSGTSGVDIYAPNGLGSFTATGSSLATTICP